jgi:hypothetical protein
MVDLVNRGLRRNLNYQPLDVLSRRNLRHVTLYPEIGLEVGLAHGIYL